MSNSHKLVAQADAHAPATHASSHNAGGTDAMTNPQFTTIELGAASDTTLSRVSAGVVAIEGTNIVKAGVATGSGITMATARLLGRTTASSGAIEEITVGTGLSLSAGSLTASAAASSLLAVVLNTAGGNKSTTSATQADVDATNAIITFTAPASGNVLFRVTCTINLPNANQNAYFGVRESTTNLVNGTTGTQVAQGQTAANLEAVVSWAAYITGISAGSHTYKLAFAVNGGTTLTVRAAAASPMTLEVWGAP